VAKGYDLTFWGWNRNRNTANIDGVSNRNIFKGGGTENKILLFYYPLWMFRLFLNLLFSRKLKEKNIIAVNFDAVLPVYIVSKIRNFKYIYEIYDEFALSYQFPTWIKMVLKKMDNKIREKANFVIHVDENRVDVLRNYKYIVIENTPYDFFHGKKRSYNLITHTFAVTGLLNNNRGLDQIIEFAKNHNQIKIILIGAINNQKQLCAIKCINNIKIYDFMPQEKLFEIVHNCAGIFSLYNPKLEINKLAASNKVYDAMMLGIPVITNVDVLNSALIKKMNIGYVVNYNYDLSWRFLASSDYLKTVKIMGENGRNLYLENFNFPKLIEQRLLPILAK
jgi:glycosyltransferase involved in cell wall biosynthesis